MARALRMVTVERGIDPRRFALMPFGGAGPLHAAALARELGIERIAVPARVGGAQRAGPGRRAAAPRRGAHGDAGRRAAQPQNVEDERDALIRRVRAELGEEG